MAGYSPFMGTPWGNSLYTASDAQGPPTLELPNSPMSPGKDRPEPDNSSCVLLTELGWLSTTAV
jgi:hypothetical protein